MRWNSNMLRTSATSFILLIFLITADLSIILDVHVFRQILGLVFLAIVPGALILCIIKLDKLRLSEKLLLSLGLSISFIMFIGFFINALSLLIGYNKPLSVEPLTISITFVILILMATAHFRGGFTFFPERSELRLDVRDKAALFIPLFFPLLSIFGMHLMNSNGNNSIIMALLLLIPAYVVLVSVFRNQIPEKAYPPIIFLISISLVFLLAMRGDHIIGNDAHHEYYIFMETLFYSKWQVMEASSLGSCLSISVLPAIYQSILNTNSEYLFKMLYPFLFSVSPIVIYIICKNYMSDIYCFLASIFFMSQIVFLSTASNPRTTVAILFFALSIMVLFNNEYSRIEKKIFIIVFIFSCIVSHYSTSYIYFIVLLFAWILERLICRLIAYKDSSFIKKNFQEHEQNIMYFASRAVGLELSKSYMTIGILTIFFVFIFLWYSQVTDVAFNSGLGFLVQSLESLQDFFVLESRNDNVAMAFGSGVGEFIISRKISFVFSWLTILFIAIGVLTTLTKYRRTLSLPYGTFSSPFCFRSKKIDLSFFILAIICSSIMATSVALPYVSKGYGIDRAYLQMMVVLSLFFILGGVNVAEFINIRRKYLIVLIILVPFFLCTTGAMHQVFGYPGSMILNSKGDSYDMMYICDMEAISAKWLKDYAWEAIKIYGDYWVPPRLISQGGIRSNLSIIFPEEFLEDKKPIENIYIYLRYYNIKSNKIFLGGNQYYNITELSTDFDMKETIYNNGGTRILF